MLRQNLDATPQVPTNYIDSLQRCVEDNTSDSPFFLSSWANDFDEEPEGYPFASLLAHKASPSSLADHIAAKRRRDGQLCDEIGPHTATTVATTRYEQQQQQPTKRRSITLQGHRDSCTSTVTVQRPLLPTVSDLPPIFQSCCDNSAQNTGANISWQTAQAGVCAQAYGAVCAPQQGSYENANQRRAELLQHGQLLMQQALQVAQLIQQLK